MKRVKLAAARTQKKHWSLEEAAAQIGVTANTLNRWELGKSNPYPYNIGKICEIYGETAENLGLTTDDHEPMPLTGLSEHSDLIRSDLTTHLIAIAMAVHRSHQELRDEINRALIGHEEATRREALRRLATLPLVSGNLQNSDEVALNLYAAGVVACGHLNNSNHEDMQLAHSMISAYLPVLDKITGSSRYHKAATMLTSQALQVVSRSAGHLVSMKQAQAHGETAVEHARASGDRTTLVMALRALSADYEWGIMEHPERREKALQLAEEARSIIEQKQGQRVNPFLQSWVYTGLAKYQALYGMEQEMLVSLAKAEETFFESSDVENIPGHISHSQAHLVRHRAIAYAFLGKQNKAFDIFSDGLIDTDNQFASKLPMASRVRLGTLSEFVFTTLFLPNALKDKALSVEMWKAKMKEATALRSESYFDEARNALQIMRGIWSDEADVAELRDLLVHW